MKHVPIALIFVLIFARYSPSLFSQETRASTETDRAGILKKRLQRIDEMVEQAIAEKKMPGAVVAIGHKELGLVYEKAFGHASLLPLKVPMQKDTVFDLASLTKPIATATSIMILVERGQVRLRDRVSVYYPEFGSNGKERITIQQLLTHTGGLIPDNALSDYQDGRDQAFRNIESLKPVSTPGSKFSYTDVGFIVLGKVVEKVTRQSVGDFAQENIFKPLEMNETGFNPKGDLKVRAAVTTKRKGEWIQGEVHDPRAFELGGEAGHAGLFSTAQDLSRFCQMFLNDGKANHGQVMSRRTIEVMTQRHELPNGGYRGLGWDKLSGYSSNRGELMTESAFGHGGFTGTSLWIDPELDLYVIFLGNRVHPDGRGSVNRLAGRIGTVAAALADEIHELAGPKQSSR